MAAEVRRMSQRDRCREVLTAPLTGEMLAQRASQGWRAVAVEWERTEDSGPPALESVPYGMRVAADHVHLEECPEEMEALLVILEGIVVDWPMSRIAADLNVRELVMRNGMPWNQTSVFELLPRLTEFGPRLFNRSEWVGRRRSMRQKMTA